MDITDRKELEETLRQDRQQLSEALEAAKMANWSFDLATGCFTFNDDFYRLAGTTVEQEGGYDMPAEVYAQKFVHPDDSYIVGTKIQEAIDSPDPNYKYEGVSRMIRANGEVIYVMVRTRIEKDAENRTIRLHGANQDVTEQVRTQELIAQRAAELATVAEVSTVITTILDPDEMLQQVVDMTKERFNLYHAHIYILDEQGDNLVLRAGASGVGRQMVKEGRSIALDTEKSLVARTARSRKGLIVNRVHEDPDFLSNPLLPDTHAEMAVPLLAGDQLLGVLDVQDATVDRFTEENINVLTTLASQVAVSLQNARSYIRAQQQAERESLINAISERIQSTTSVESALQVAVRELGRALGAQRTVIQLGLQQQETPHNN
jgi:PAS domain S-box-containing protein